MHRRTVPRRLVSCGGPLSVPSRYTCRPALGLVRFLCRLSPVSTCLLYQCFLYQPPCISRPISAALYRPPCIGRFLYRHISCIGPFPVSACPLRSFASCASPSAPRAACEARHAAGADRRHSSRIRPSRTGRIRPPPSGGALNSGISLSARNDGLDEKGQHDHFEEGR